MKFREEIIALYKQGKGIQKDSEDPECSKWFAWKHRLRPSLQQSMMMAQWCPGAALLPLTLELAACRRHDGVRKHDGIKEEAGASARLYPINTSKSTGAGFQEKFWKILQWLSQSPDLNPTKDLCWDLKKAVAACKCKNINELETITQKESESAEGNKVTFCAIWRTHFVILVLLIYLILSCLVYYKQCLSILPINIICNGGAIILNATVKMTLFNQIIKCPLLRGADRRAQNMCLCKETST